MNDDHHEQRSTVKVLDGQFKALIKSLDQLAGETSDEVLYKRPPRITIGENILRSAACLEQVFGGLTANLWDDPFEWTLPETLSTTERIREYLAEVDVARTEFFEHLHDAALVKLIAAPSGEQKPIIGVLLESLVVSSDYRGRAVVISKLLRI